jgi:hypothetical protein
VKRFLNKQQIADIRAKFATIEDRTNKLVINVASHQFRNELAREYAQHGFARRVGTLRRCIENVFRIIPPGTVKVPSKARLYDAQIQVQSFIANVFGSVDNLAWVVTYERGLDKKIPRNHVGLRKTNVQVRSALSSELQSRLQEMNGWFEYVTEYRDALAHRIPLYIPPGAVLTRHVEKYNDLMNRMTSALNNLRPYEYERLSAEQSKLLVFQPMITHSIRETTGHIPFHIQMIADFLTVEELGQKILAELKRST